MNRHRWLHENDVEAMVQHVYDRARPRKVRLFLAACLRRVLDHASAIDPMAARHLSAVEMVEQMADGLVSSMVLGLHRASLSGGEALPLAIHSALADPLLLEDVGRSLAYMVASVQISLPTEAVGVACSFLRELHGDPFAPVEISPHWRTSEAREMARGIYTERAFDRLPILADALLDAGCDSEPVLAHCRAEGHLRGCWLVDGLLERGV